MVEGLTNSTQSKGLFLFEENLDEEERMFGNAVLVGENLFKVKVEDNIKDGHAEHLNDAVIDGKVYIFIRPDFISQIKPLR